MTRPYVICHMLASMDGKIDGDFFGAPETVQLRSEYARIRNAYGCDAVLNGTVTAAEIYADGYLGSVPQTAERYPKQDRIFPAETEDYVIAADAEGVLAWRSNTVTRGGKTSGIVVITVESVSDGYLKTLEDLQISWIFAGRDALDMKTAMEKLYEKLGVRKLMTTGGGVMNWSLLQSDCLDEVSLVISPVSDGRKETAGIFARSEYVTGTAKAFRLDSVRQLEHSGLHLVYKI